MVGHRSGSYGSSSESLKVDHPVDYTIPDEIFELFAAEVVLVVLEREKVVRDHLDDEEHRELCADRCEGLSDEGEIGEVLEGCETVPLDRIEDAFSYLAQKSISKSEVLRTVVVQMGPVGVVVEDGEVVVAAADQ